MSNEPPPPAQSPGPWPPPAAPMGNQPKPKKPMWQRKRVLIPTALLGLLIVGAAVSGGSSTGSDTDDSANDAATSATTAAPASTDDESTDEATTESATDTTDAPVETTEALAETTAVTEVELSEADDILSCTRIDEENILIEAINNSPKTSTYWLTVAYFDEAGARLADSTEFLSNLRPNERAAEAMYVFESAGTTCEVIDVDRSAAESDPGEMAEIGECAVTGPDYANDVEATVTATNGSSQTSDYAIEIAFVGADGIRVGHGTAYIEAVRTGESAPGDIFSSTDYDPALTCEVVAVTRNANT